MKIGAYENPEKSLEFVRFDTNGRIWNGPWINLNTFEHKSYYDYYFEYRKKDELLLNVPLPTRDCLKERYEIGDLVYYQVLSNNMLCAGTITKKRDYNYVIDDCMSRLPHRLLPYHYYSLHTKCRLAIHWFLLISRRLGICKDIRKLIGSYIWRLRNEYEWDCNHKHTLKRLAHKKIKYSE